MKIRVYDEVAVAINRTTIKEKYSGKATAGQFHSSRVRKNADRLAIGLQPDYSDHLAIGAAIVLP